MALPNDDQFGVVAYVTWFVCSGELRMKRSSHMLTFTATMIGHGSWLMQPAHFQYTQSTFKMSTLLLFSSVCVCVCVCDEQLLEGMDANIS